MEIIDRIPSNIMMERKLTREQEMIFLEQINRFNELNDGVKINSSPIIDSSGKIILKKEMIIHGMGKFSEDVLDIFLRVE